MNAVKWFCRPESLKNFRYIADEAYLFTLVRAFYRSVDLVSTLVTMLYALCCNIGKFHLLFLSEYFSLRNDPRTPLQRICQIGARMIQDTFKVCMPLN